MKKIINLVSVFALIILICSKTFAGNIVGKIETDASKTQYKANTVVYIEKVNGNFEMPKINPKIEQKYVQFVPRVLPVLVGSTVDFVNYDDIPHNVFTPDACAGKFDLGAWKGSEIRSHKYDKVGCNSVVLCNIHPNMSAYVVVLQNPYFCITDEVGNFSIKNVPPGKYVVKVWNEKLKAQSKEITVSVGDIKMNFQLKK